MDTITLERYEQAERLITREAAWSGLLTHVAVTVLVSTGLVLLNVLVAPEFPWSPFPVAGMTIGLVLHWWFGWRRLEGELTRKQREVEARAARLA